MIFMTLLSIQAFSQDVRIFENTWYLHNLVINGESNIPPINNEIPFVPADFIQDGDILTGMCQEFGFGELEYFGSTEFRVLELNFLAGGCQQNFPVNQNYSSLYISFWGSMGLENTSYEIIIDGPNRTLIVNSQNDDYAIFKNEVPLAINDFSQSKFSIFPTVVKTSFTIQNKSFNKIRKILIYNSNGQLVKNYNKLSTEIDISNLSKGLYLVSIHSDDSNVETKKIIKL